MMANERRFSKVCCVLGAVFAFTTAGAQSAGPAPKVSSSGAKAGAATAGPSVAELERALRRGYGAAKGLTSGKNADYIPALAQVDPNLFGIAIVTVDGRVLSIGDVDHLFSIQSVSKPFVAAELMKEVGPETVEKKLGVNATGLPFNSIEAIEQNRAAEAPPTANPLVNAGAIATVANLRASSSEERWDTVLGTLSAFAGRKLQVDPVIYESEAASNTRNRSIAELLKAYDVIPGDPNEALDVYTRQCSVTVNVRDLAMMGATLASGGLNPRTKERVISPDIAAKTLAVMMTAGMYEDSGTWAFEVGLPAKSGVGGGIVAVVPGQYAIAAFSPRLDGAGNSVRAQKAIEVVAEELGSNVFEAPRVSRRP